MIEKQSKFLAIIPARGGSKRLPRKNILELNGKPLISYTIEAALKSQYIHKTLVTSDDDEILQIAKDYNIATLKRDKILSSDTANSIDVVLDTIEKEKNTYDFIILLQPTSPLRTAKHIDEAIELLFEKKAAAVISLCEVEHPIQWTTQLEENKSLDKFIHQLDIRRSQEQQTYYRLNGAIYIINTQKICEEKSFFLQQKSYAYIMSQKDSIDIDTEIDFILAKTILETQLQSQTLPF